MLLKYTNIQIISYFVWLFVILFSSIFYLKTQYFGAAAIIYGYNIFVSILGIYYTNKVRHLYIFNPFFWVIYSSIFYYTFMGLYCLSKYNTIGFLKPATSNSCFLSIISLIFVTCFILMLLPSLLSNIQKKKLKFKFKSLKRNYNIKKTCKYLYFTFPIIVILYFLLCFASGFTPLSAILNPAEFRNASSRDLANIVYIFYQPLFVINLIITMQLAILKNIKSKSFNLYIKLFTLYCLFWGIFSGGRSWFVSYVVLMTIIYALKKRIKINTKLLIKGLITIALLIVFIGAYGSYRNYRTAISKGQIARESSLSAIEKVLFRMDTYSMSLEFFKYINSTYGNLYDYTGNLNKAILAQATQLIPRRFYPQKQDDAHGELTKMVRPEVYYGGVHLIYGGVSLFFYEGGLVWLFLLFLTLGFFVMIFQNNVKYLRNYDIFQLFYVYFFTSIIGQCFNLGILNNAATSRIFIKIIFYLLIIKYIAQKTNVHYYYNPNYKKIKTKGVIQ